ncbi:unnamed protein product, partial [Meganyctiphanes norvegica]
VVLSVAAVSTLSLAQSGLKPPAITRMSDGSYSFSYETPSSSHFASQGRHPARQLSGKNPKFTIGHSVVRSPKTFTHNVPNTLSTAASSRSFSTAPGNVQSDSSNIFSIANAPGRFYFVADDGVKRTVRYGPPEPVAKKPNALVNPNVFVSTRRTHFPAVYRDQVNKKFAPQPSRRQADSNVIFSPAPAAVQKLKTSQSQTSSRLVQPRSNGRRQNKSLKQSEEDDSVEDDSEESSEKLPDILSKFIANYDNVNTKSEVSEDTEVVHINQGKNSGVWGYSFSTLYQ